jgi:hypothetical protein
MKAAVPPASVEPFVSRCNASEPALGDIDGWLTSWSEHPHIAFSQLLGLSL